MKYIRTKDGIIKSENAEKHIGFYFPNVSESYIEEADTIEELCDEFVFDGVDEKPLICDDIEELIYWFNYSEEQQYSHRVCYGAIWTDKGLIYVAKMNVKGELELL